MTVTDIFNQVYNHFLAGEYTIANPKNRNQTKPGNPPKMTQEQALRHTANYILWEWTIDHNDQKFANLIKAVCLPPTDYDLSSYSFKDICQVICPEIIKTNPDEFK
jgi:hypothetical protein